MNQLSNNIGIFYSLPKYIEKYLSSDYLPQNRYTIVKYRPEYYINGCYNHNEWTSFTDIGRHFDDGILTSDEYYKVENNYISCVKELAYAANCKYLTFGYIESYSELIVKKSNGLHFLLQQGYRISIKDIDDSIKKVLREEAWIVFINKSKSFMIDFGYDYYMHIRCNLDRNCVLTIVNNNNLFLDPRY